MKLRHVLLVAGCVLAWIAVVEHPSARNLRSAIASTVPLV
jgi:hypothetical protein